MVDAFRFDDRRAALVMLLWSRQARGQQFFLPLGDEGLVFAMCSYNNAQLFRQLQRLVELGVIDPKCAFVGQENLKRGNASRDDLAQLSRVLVIEPRYPHVVGVITGRLSRRLFLPKPKTFRRTHLA